MIASRGTHYLLTGAFPGKGTKSLFKDPDKSLRCGSAMGRPVARAKKKSGIICRIP